MSAPDSQLEQLLEVEQVLKSLCISRSRLHKYVKTGELPAVKLGRRVRFRVEAINAFIRSHESAAPVVSPKTKPKKPRKR